MRRRLTRTTVVAAVLGLALLCASPALSAQDPVIADCIANQQVTGNYTVAQLRHALNTLPPTTKEYTNCYDAINRALQAKLGTGHGNGASDSSGGSFLPTWLVIVLILLVLAAAVYGVLAYRQRSEGGGGEGQ